MCGDRFFIDHPWSTYRLLILKFGSVLRTNWGWRALDSALDHFSPLVLRWEIVCTDRRRETQKDIQMTIAHPRCAQKCLSSRDSPVMPAPSLSIPQNYKVPYVCWNSRPDINICYFACIFYGFPCFCAKQPTSAHCSMLFECMEKR